MSWWIWLIIIVVAALVVAGAVSAAAARRRTAVLRAHFGPEYERTVDRSGRRRAAEAELLAREQERSRVTIRPLPEPARARFVEQWAAVQQGFVDQPVNAVVAADGLVCTVMGERGYPVDDFAAQSGLVSVDHPHVVENFRVAHAIYERAQRQLATTEELREAMLRYRSLFDELLLVEAGPAAHRAE